MADDLGAGDDRTFREGGALHKISELAKSWEARALKAERSRRASQLERAAWFLAGLAAPPVVIWLVQHGNKLLGW